MYSETPNAIDYAAVLADLKAKRATIDAMIAATEQFIIQPGVATLNVASAPQVLHERNGSQEHEFRSDSFFWMSIPEAAKKYLSMMKKSKSTRG